MDKGCGENCGTSRRASVADGVFIRGVNYVLLEVIYAESQKAITKTVINVVVDALTSQTSRESENL